MSVANITNRLKEIAKKMEELVKKEVVVGIPSGSGSDGDISLVELGMIHEFGSPDKGIPERSFIRSTSKEEASNLGKLTSIKVKELLNDKISVNDVYSAIGKHLSGQVIDKFGSSSLAPNKPETVKRKGSNSPLIDNGALIGAITYEVRNES